MNGTRMVYVVEDDEGFVSTLQQVLEDRGFIVKVFTNGTDALSAFQGATPDCLLLDLALPDLDGLQLQRDLAAREIRVPVVFMSGKAAIADSVQAMRAGAADFLEKPFTLEALIASIDDAMSSAVREAGADQGAGTPHGEVLDRYGRLTPREREVMGLICSGCSSREAGGLLGISPRTVDHHRARIMDKMGAASLAELGRMAAVCAERFEAIAR